MKRDSGPGFTLIELLIVVAIIGILAAIAVPNFLNARIRAGVARVESDLRALSVAVDSYRVDLSNYPPDWVATGGAVQERGFIRAMHMLTTPVAYISNIDLMDPFYVGPDRSVDFPGGGAYGDSTYRYYCYRYGWGDAVSHQEDGYVILSYGPDKFESFGEWCGIPRGKDWDGIYAPSNGIRSNGDIVRPGGSVDCSAWQRG
ncbi:MAG: prepilin-type N-terminal cleavage/methylation domain-containing protein [bacterium]